MVLLSESLESSTVNVTQIKHWTDHDPVLTKLRQFVRNGWPRSVDSELQPFHSRRLELSIQENCLLWGSRVVIPRPGREKILSLLHEGHPGICKMKSLARNYVWWPKIDADLGAKVKQCNQCQLSRPSSPIVPMHPWDWPEHPWKCIHVGYAGPISGKMFLIVVDAHSKWMEAEIVNSATSQATIECLRMIFARFGLPEVMVTDNGTCFTSSEFQEFAQCNNIRHVRIAPYHPSSNGLAERAVQTFKLGIKKQLTGTLQTKLSRFLFHYRLTPNTTTGVAPAELLLTRRPRSHLDSVVPHAWLKNKVQQQQKQKAQHDQHSKSHHFKQGDLVFILEFHRGAAKLTWLPGTVIQKDGGPNYEIKLSDNQIVRRHADHIRSHESDCEDVLPREEMDDVPIPVIQPTPVNAPVSVVLRCSQRVRKPPEHFQS